METKFNFKSQICTTREQSERLLSLGLKKETADIVHYFSQSLAQDWTIVPLADGETAKHIQGLEIPAWSLHRLIKDLMPDTIAVENATFMGQRFFYVLTFMYDDVTYEVNSFVFKEFAEHDNYYDNIIDCIEWLIKEGYFNKEYLV